MLRWSGGWARLFGPTSRGSLIVGGMVGAAVIGGATILLPSLALAASPPPNDNLATAASITDPLPYADLGVNTSLATTETGEPTPSCVFGVNNTVWYKYVPTATTTVSASVIPTSIVGNDIHAVAAAYDGTAFNNFVQQGCEASSTTNGSVYLAFPVTAGHTYYFQVGSNASYSDGPTEAFDFHLALVGAPGAPGTPTAFAGSGKAGVYWGAADPGSSPITFYTVTASPGGETCVTGGATSCVVIGLTNGVSYTFSVSATNSIGTGPTSPNSNSVTPFAGATYHTLTPARILDSRTGLGFVGPLQEHVAKTFQVTGQGGVPANTVAITGNLTVTGQTSLGYLFLGPVATSYPTSSTLNFPLGDDRANGVTVALSGSGSLSVTYVAPVGGQTAHGLFDVTGYFMQ